MTRDQQPAKQDVGDLVEQAHDLAAARDVARVVPHGLRGREHVDEVDPERLGVLLALAFGLFNGHAEDREGCGETTALGRRPPIGWFTQSILAVPRRRARPLDRAAGLGAGAEDRPGPPIARLCSDGAPVWADRCYRDLAVRDVAARVQRERDPVNDAPNDGEREHRAGLARPPVVDDDPARDAGLGADADVRHARAENSARIAEIRRRDEWAGCRRARDVVLYGCLSGRSDAGSQATVSVGTKTGHRSPRPWQAVGFAVSAVLHPSASPHAASCHQVGRAIGRATRRRFPCHWARNATPVPAPGPGLARNRPGKRWWSRRPGKT